MSNKKKGTQIDLGELLRGGGGGRTAALPTAPAARDPNAEYDRYGYREGENPRRGGRDGGMGEGRSSNRSFGGGGGEGGDADGGGGWRSSRQPSGGFGGDRSRDDSRSFGRDRDSGFGGRGGEERSFRRNNGPYEGGEDAGDMDPMIVSSRADEDSQWRRKPTPSFAPEVEPSAPSPAEEESQWRRGTRALPPVESGLDAGPRKAEVSRDWRSDKPATPVDERAAAGPEALQQAGGSNWRAAPRAEPPAANAGSGRPKLKLTPKTLTKGASCRTPYGKGVIEEIRADDNMFVVKLEFGALAYLRAADVVAAGSLKANASSASTVKPVETTSRRFGDLKRDNDRESDFTGGGASGETASSQARAVPAAFQSRPRPSAEAGGFPGNSEDRAYPSFGAKPRTGAPFRGSAHPVDEMPAAFSKIFGARGPARDGFNAGGMGGNSAFNMNRPPREGGEEDFARGGPRGAVQYGGGFERLQRPNREGGGPMERTTPAAFGGSRSDDRDRMRSDDRPAHLRFGKKDLPTGPASNVIAAPKPVEEAAPAPAKEEAKPAQLLPESIPGIRQKIVYDFMVDEDVQTATKAFLQLKAGSTAVDQVAPFVAALVAEARASARARKAVTSFVADLLKSKHADDANVAAGLVRASKNLGEDETELIRDIYNVLKATSSGLDLVELAPEDAKLLRGQASADESNEEGQEGDDDQSVESLAKRLVASEPESADDALAAFESSGLAEKSGAGPALVAAILAVPGTAEDAACEWVKLYGAALAQALAEAPASEQLEALNEVQRAMSNAKFPKGESGPIINSVFMKLFLNEILSEEAFFEWKDDLSSTVPGRSSAVIQTTKFFTSLEEEDEEDDDDEDDE